MSFDVSLENTSGYKTAMADVTLIGFLPGMTTDMLLQVAALLEGGNAKVAAERSVQHHRKPQVGRTRMGRHHTCKDFLFRGVGEEEERETGSM